LTKNFGVDVFEVEDSRELQIVKDYETNVLRGGIGRECRCRKPLSRRRNDRNDARRAIGVCLQGDVLEDTAVNEPASAAVHTAERDEVGGVYSVEKEFQEEAAILECIFMSESVRGRRVVEKG